MAARTPARNQPQNGDDDAEQSQIRPLWIRDVLPDLVRGPRPGPLLSGANLTGCALQTRDIGKQSKVERALKGLHVHCRTTQTQQLQLGRGRRRHLGIAHWGEAGSDPHDVARRLASDGQVLQAELSDLRHQLGPPIRGATKACPRFPSSRVGP